MNILDLEEAADLRVEDVRAYLERKGWTLKNYPPGTGQTWTDPAGKESFIMKDGWEWWMDSMVEAAVDFENRTPQAILREISPRWKEGGPSPAALAAHDGLWLVEQTVGSTARWHRCSKTWRSFCSAGCRRWCATTAATSPWPLAARGGSTARCTCASS